MTVFKIPGKLSEPKRKTLIERARENVAVQWIAAFLAFLVALGVIRDFVETTWPFIVRVFDELSRLLSPVLAGSLLAIVAAILGAFVGAFTNYVLVRRDREQADLLARRVEAEERIDELLRRIVASQSAAERKQDKGRDADQQDWDDDSADRD